MSDRDQAGLLGVPFPEQWNLQVRKHEKFIKLVRIVIVFLCLATLGAAITMNEGVLFVGWLLVLTIAGAYLSYVVSIASWKRDRSGVARKKISEGRRITFVPIVRSAEYSQQFLNAFFAGFLLLAPLLGATLDRVSSRYISTFQFVAPYFPYLAILVVPYLASWFVRRGRQMGVGLSSDGVYRWSWFGCCFYPWSTLTEISADERQALGIQLRTNGRRPESYDSEENFLSRIDRHRSKMSNIHAGYLVINPAVALRLLQFYHENPQLRHELGSDESIERVRAASFDAAAEPSQGDAKS